MLYCPNCQLLVPEGEKCSSCGRKKLREPNPDDPVLLITADELKSEMIESVFEENKQVYEERILGLGGPPSVVFGKSAITNKNIYVPYRDIDSAQTLLDGIGILDADDISEQEIFDEEDEFPEDNGEKRIEEDTEEIGAGKRTILRILSVILFVLAVWGVVSVSDFAANTLKDFLSNIK